MTSRRIIAIVVLGVAVFGGLLFAVVMKLTGGLVDTANRQLAALAAGDADTAYAELSLAARDITSPAAFTDLMRRMGMLGHQGRYSFSGRDISGDAGTLSGTYIRDDGAVSPVTLLLVREAGAWKIYGMQFGTGG
jgi:hypothetical protein